MPGIRKNSAFFHSEDMRNGNHILFGHRNKNIPDLTSLRHWKHSISIHHRLKRPKRIHFAYHHIQTKPVSSQSHAFSTRPIPANHHGFPANKTFSAKSIHSRLSRTIVIIHEVLRLVVIHRDHGVFQSAIFLHGLQTNNASEFVSSHPPIISGINSSCFYEFHSQDRTVINRDMRLKINNAPKKPIVIAGRFAFMRIHGHAFFRERRRGVVLRGEGIAPVIATSRLLP